MGHRPEESAQASAELVSVVPLVLLTALAIGQLAVAGWALVTAGEAARSGARAAEVGSDAGTAARSAVPAALGPPEVKADGSEVRVRVAAPALVPGLPSIPIAATTALNPAAGAP